MAYIILTKGKSFDSGELLHRVTHHAAHAQRPLAHAGQHDRRPRQHPVPGHVERESLLGLEGAIQLTAHLARQRGEILRRGHHVEAIRGGDGGGHHH